MRTASKFLCAFVIATALAAPALAQQADPDRTVRPYWWDRPVVEVIGRGEREVAPNRAAFTATFQETDKEAGKALKRATDRASVAVQAMQRELGSSARIVTNVTNDPYYQQYRNKDNDMVEDDRPDRVQGYRARVVLYVDLLDVAAAGRARAAALAVGMERAGRLNFRLEQTPALQQELIRSAAQDARARAQAAASAAGATLGDLLVLQEGSSQCLGGWGSRQVARQTGGGDPNTLTLMNGRRIATASEDAPLPVQAMQAVDVLREGASATYGAGAIGGVANFVTGADVDRFELESDPPPLQISSTVCAVYALR